MKIRKYIARNMPEALQQVRDDLGEDAVILNTRQIRRNNRFNPEGEAHVEVTAAFDEGGAVLAAAVSERRSAPVNVAAQRYASQMGDPSVPRTTPLAEVAARRVVEPPVPPQDITSGEGVRGSGEIEKVSRQLRQLQDTVTRLERRGGAAVVLPNELARLAERLRNMGVAAALVDETISELLHKMAGKALDDREKIGVRAAAILVRHLPACKHIRIGKRRKIVGFFGSSGAGKTTAVAKIAAGFALKRKERIVIITADDRRVGGLDQARAFAHIIGVTLEPAYSEEEVAAVVEKHANAQLILVDAPGCGPHDHRERERQQRLFAAAGTQEVHVVLEALSGLEHMLDLIEASEVYGERRLLFTKVDEVARLGSILSAAALSQIPTSYMTVGAQVPGDIEAGQMDKIVAQIVGHAPGKRD